MFKIESQTYGSDFEVGVALQNGDEVIPVTGNLGGTKEEPVPIGRNCYSQEDGPMAEFNIPPVRTEDEWSDYFDYCIQKGAAILNQAGLKFKIFSSHEYTDDQLNENNLRVMGCDPSNDAYTGEQTKPDGDTTNLRTCGVHFHVGFVDTYKNQKFEFYEARELAKYFDMYMGVPSLLIDDDTRRRELYGKAGDFRVKILNDEDTNINIQLFEYRTLGGNLLKDDNIIRWSFRQMEQVIEHFNNQTDLPYPGLIQETINTSDVDTAKILIEKYKICLPN